MNSTSSWQHLLIELPLQDWIAAISEAARVGKEVVIEVTAHQMRRRAQIDNRLVPGAGLSNVVMDDAIAFDQLAPQRRQRRGIRRLPGAARGVGDEMKGLGRLAGFALCDLFCAVER